MRTRSLRFLGFSLLFGAAACLGAACGGDDASPSGETPGDASPDTKGEGDAANDARTSNDAAPDASADGSDGNSGDAGDGGRDSGDGSTSCVTDTIDLPRTPAYARVVLDGSKRMDGMGTLSGGLAYLPGSRETDTSNPQRPTIPDGTGDMSKAGLGTRGATGKNWIAVRSALNDAWNILSNDPPDLTLGIGFHVINGTTVVPDDQIDVPTAAVTTAHQGALQRRMASVVADNGTAKFPIGNVYPGGDLTLLAAINGQGKLLQTFDPASAGLAPGGRRYLVLFVNGVPSDDVTDPATSASVKAIARLRTANPPVTTFVIGTGDPANPTDYSARLLGHLAKAGGGEVTDTCNPDWSGETTSSPCHYQITPGSGSSEIVRALIAIRERVMGCDFALPSAHPAIDPARANVQRVPSSGPATQIARDPVNGWTFDDEQAPAMVRFHGRACNSFLGNPSTKARLVLGCKTNDPVVQ